MNFNMQANVNSLSNDIITIAMEFNKIYDKLINNSSNNSFRNSNNSVGTTQFTNILRNMRYISCLKEFKLFINYQESKDKDKGWAVKIGDKSLAKHLIVSIVEIEDIVNEMIKKEKFLDDIMLIESFKIKCVEKFLGYCYWYVYSASKGNSVLV